jgi:hypothetical protein
LTRANARVSKLISLKNYKNKNDLPTCVWRFGNIEKEFRFNSYCRSFGRYPSLIKNLIACNQLENQSRKPKILIYFLNKPKKLQQSSEKKEEEESWYFIRHQLQAVMEPRFKFREDRN